MRTILIAGVWMNAWIYWHTNGTPPSRALFVAASLVMIVELAFLARGWRRGRRLERILPQPTYRAFLDRWARLVAAHVANHNLAPNDGQATYMPRRFLLIHPAHTASRALPQDGMERLRDHTIAMFYDDPHDASALRFFLSQEHGLLNPIVLHLPAASQHERMEERALSVRHDEHPDAA